MTMNVYFRDAALYRASLVASSNVLISNSWLARINPNVKRICFGLKR
jgi:hypothetical protein